MNELRLLVQRAQNGDRTAYNHLIQRFQKMAVAYSYAKLGDRSLAEDVAQEAFLSAYRTLDQLREPAAFPGWFRRVVQGQINRHQRQQQPHFVVLEAANQIVNHSSPIAMLEAQEDQQEVLAAIDALPAAHRTVITLFYIGEYSQQAISAFLEIPVATVKTRLHYARLRLKERLTAEQVTTKWLRNVVQENLTEQAITTRVMRLFKAIIEDDLATAHALLTADPTLAHARGLEWSDFWHGEVAAIHLAVIHRRKAMVDLLLAYGANINEREGANFTVLHFAANMALAGVISTAEGDEWFAFLVERGAKPDIGVYFWRNELEQVRALLAAEPTQANQIGVQNATPLCYVMDIRMAQLLLDYGADPFLALENTWCKEYGADTPMRWAASRPERPDFFRFLLNYTGTPIDIHLACALGDAAEVKRFLAADPLLLEALTGATHVLLSDLTPLHVAALYRQAAIAKLLLERGAKPNVTTASVHKMTPLHLAVMYSAGDEDEIRVDVPQLLLAYGADVTLRDSVRQMTPLEWAEGKYMADEKGRAAVVTLLRAHSA